MTKCEIVIEWLFELSELRPEISFIHGYIDVGDGCWRRFMWIRTLRFWLGKKSPILYFRYLNLNMFTVILMTSWCWWLRLMTNCWYWWHLLNVVRHQCKNIVVVGDQNGQNRHQYLEVVSIVVTNIFRFNIRHENRWSHSKLSQ